MACWEGSGEPMFSTGYSHDIRRLGGREIGGSFLNFFVIKVDSATSFLNIPTKFLVG
jgi:hypothetical protein